MCQYSDEDLNLSHKTWNSEVYLPVMAAIAVRKKVISIGHFSPCFRLQSLQIFHLLEEIKSNCMHWMHWKSEKNRTEPNELDELKYSKSLTQMTSHAHWHVLVFACSDMYQNIHLSHLKLEKKKTKLNELSELEYWKTPWQMSSYAHWLTCIYMLRQVSKHLFIFPIWNQKKKLS